MTKKEPDQVCDAESLESQDVNVNEIVLSSGTDLYYNVDNTQHSIKLVEPIAHNINECTVKIQSVPYNLITTQTKQEINDQFVGSCKTGDLKETIRLLNSGANVRYLNDSAFRYSCDNGNIETAKWLHSLGANIHADNDHVFSFSCRKRHIEIAKWLHSLGANIHAGNDCAFRWSCFNGDIETAKWLHSLGADIHAKNDYGFRWSCRKGHIEMAKWLYSLGANIHAGNNFALKWIRANKRIETAMWLQGLIDNKKKSRKLCHCQPLVDSDPSGHCQLKVDSDHLGHCQLKVESDPSGHIKSSQSPISSDEPIKIEVKIFSGTDLFYTVDDIQYSIKLVEPIAHNINERTVKIQYVPYYLVNTFSDTPRKDVITGECRKVVLPEGTTFDQNGILAKFLVCTKNLTLGHTFNAMLPKGTKLQKGSACFTLENEVECVCEYA